MDTELKDYEIAEQELAALIPDNLTLDCQFVPHSKSRNAKESRCLNWIVTVKQGARIVWAGPYSKGFGHVPGYSKHVTKRMFLEPVVNDMAEKGIAPVDFAAYLHPATSDLIRDRLDKPVTCQPTILEVVSAWLMDSPNGATFEEWAADLGFSTDSIKALETFTACKDEELAARRVFGANFDAAQAAAYRL